MLLHELFEARKNPDQNPKVPINQLIIQELDKATDSIADTTNLFVSFTAIDKLGINPTSVYKTPIGIYAYPAEYVVRMTGANKKMTTLPFAGESPYVNTFSVQGNIINVSTISAGEVRGYYRELSDLWAKTSGKDWKTSVDEIEQYINEAGYKAKFADLPGGQLWYVTMRAATDLFGAKWKLKPSVAWNKLFRSIGIDGVVDYSNDGGQGIIHTSEPSQAVFFVSTVIKNVKRFDNSYSPDLGNRQMKRDIGQQRHVEISAIGAKLKTLKTPEEVYQYLRDVVGLHHIRLIKDPTIREYVLGKQPNLISWIRYPSAKEQEIALLSDFNNIDGINNPDESVVVKLLRDNPDAQFAALGLERLIAMKIPNAGEELQIILVRDDPTTIEKFNKPSTKALMVALRRSRPLPPVWMLNMAKSKGIDIGQFKPTEEPDSIKDLRNELRLIEQDRARHQQQIVTLNADWEEMSQEMKAANRGDDYINKMKSKYHDPDVAEINTKLDYLDKRQVRIQQQIDEYNAMWK